jgi:DNA-binding transcriptional ArsR family regulator
VTLDFPGGKVNGARPSPAGPRLTWCLAETEDVFAALGDTTRLGILGALWRDDASISDLAARFGMTLTGIAKHVRVLEDALLVATEKVGRVGPAGSGRAGSTRRRRGWPGTGRRWKNGTTRWPGSSTA